MGHLQDMHIIIQQDPKSLIGEEYRMVTQFPKKTKAGKLKGGHVWTWIQKREDMCKEDATTDVIVMIGAVDLFKRREIAFFDHTRK